MEDSQKKEDYFSIFDSDPVLPSDQEEQLPDAQGLEEDDDSEKKEESSILDVGPIHPDDQETLAGEEGPEDEDDVTTRGYGSDDSADPDEDMTGIEKKPSYRKANSMRFQDLCKKLDFLDRLQSEKHSVKRKLSKEEKLNVLLRPELLKKLRPGSPFPLFRLLMADKDTSRRTITKQKSLAASYAEVLGYEKKSAKAEALRYFENPIYVNKAGFVEKPNSGDFSLVVQAAVRDRGFNNKGSAATVGSINDALDNLVAGLANSRKTSKGNSGSSQSQQWRYRHSQTQTQRRSQSQSKTRVNPGKVRQEFVKCLVDRLKLSPLEHKWLVRMVLEDGLKIGIGADAILAWYSPHANDLWKSHNSLKAVCDKLANENYVKQRELEIQQAEERMKTQRFSQLYEVGTNPDPVRLGNTISAMKSERTSFESCMADMAAKHRDVIKKLKDDAIKDSLALKFPAFMAEVKLDGERMIVHVNRGKVTMHTRQGRWYSPLYSPTIGPALRKALSKYDIDCILDGEILAWDNRRGQCVEFGSNRTVAILRQNWLRARGKIEDIDKKLHQGDKDAYIIEFDDAKNWSFDRETKIDPDEMEGGDQVWIKFVVFDVLLVGGPDGKKVLADSLSLDTSSSDAPSSATGSVAHLSGFERKRILHHLIEEQKNEIDIVESVVIRPNGECTKAEEYFSASDPLMECGMPAHTLDSAKWTLNVGHPALKEFDNTRRKQRMDVEISKLRTYYVNDFYHQIVDKQKLEGLVFKDLAAPYVLRTKTGSWRKIKPDYSSTSFASDIDVVIIGASYGVGSRRGGQVASFLGACVDSQNPDKFMPFCRLNAKSFSEGKLDEIMESTDFKKGENLGKWFVSDADGEDGEALPDFISQRSLQFGTETQDGWKFDRVQIYPDLWIRPKDSVVLVVNASEIVTSTEYSAGVTLRFPRATRARYGADAKPAEEVENEQKLTEMLYEYRSKMKQYATPDSSFEVVSPSKSQRARGDDTDLPICEFLTDEQYLRKQKQKKRRQKEPGRVRFVREVKKESNALSGIKFHVVEGAYSFDPEGIDADQARSEGWFEEAMDIQSASDVETFIMKHGGQVLRTPSLDVYIVGGSCDFKVENQIRGMEVLKAKNARKRKVDDIVDVNIPGVLRWSYVLSLVHRWLNEVKRRLQELDGYSSDESEDGDFENNDESILNTLPDMLKPRFFDFLAQSKEWGDDLFQSIWRYGALDTTTMKQALSLLQQEADEEVRRNKIQRTEEAEHVPWQYSAFDCLSEENRWVLSCQYQKLWPYGNGGADWSAFPLEGKEKQPVIVYPDLFGENFGRHVTDWTGEDLDADERWKQAPAANKSSVTASSLPLVRSMGCHVTVHLTSRVTHVLCDLGAQAGDSVSWIPGSVLDVFKDKEHGLKLQQCLEETVGHPVQLVTRNWANTIFEN